MRRILLALATVAVLAVGATTVQAGPLCRAWAYRPRPYAYAYRPYYRPPVAVYPVPRPWGYGPGYYGPGYYGSYYRGYAYGPGVSIGVW